MKKKNKVIIIVLSSILVVFIGIFIYLSTSYKATEEVYIYLESSDQVEVFKDVNNYYTFKPVDPKGAIIFYPGGKVQDIAYAPLLFKLAEEGYLTVLVNFAFNLAVFEVDAASKVRNLYPEIDNWYLSGHSLGGSMAASHLSKHVDDYKGLIMLASYSTANLSEYESLNIMSIYGSNDGVLNMDKYNKNSENLAYHKTYVIQGGNHANFGYYGNQKGDGVASITKEEQINLTVEFIAMYL